MKKIVAIMLIMLLGVCACADTVNGDSSDTRIRAVQQQLVTVQLLDASQVTGEWDEETIKATLRFQRFVNNVQGEGTLEENGECDDSTAGYLEFASGKSWDVGAQVAYDDVQTPNEAAAAQAAAEEAAREKAEQDSATIAYVQSMLRQLGLLEEVNGEYDEATREAIVRAQTYINETQGEGTVEVNGAYDDPETMAWLNRGTEEKWVISKETPVEVPETAAVETEGESEPAETGEAQPAEPAQPAAETANGVSRIENFRLTIDGEERTGTVELEPGRHAIAWSGDNVAMFSMYMYDSGDNLLNKSENMDLNYFTLDTFGMASGAVYEIRIGAVPNGGQVADMEWRSLFVTLK